METAQKLIDLASKIVGSTLSKESSNSSSKKKKKIGAKNQVYYAKMNSSCPPALVPMLTTMVNGALKSKNTLLKCAKEDGLFDMPASELPPNCPPLNKNDPNPELIVVLYEALLGSRRVRGTSPIVKLIKSRKASLQQRLAKRRKNGQEYSFSKRVKLPRFVRVNLLKTSVVEAKRHFENKLGLRYYPPPSSNNNNDNKTDDSSTDNTVSIKPGTFTMDPVIPQLFVLPCGTNLHADTLVEEGALVLQDRSSCLTAIALSPFPPNAVCIDTCASPGNKTLHMASLMGKDSGGKIIAFERDLTRLETLERRIVEQGASSFITTRGEDFTKADLSHIRNDVTHILIDPSCSGSGLVAATPKNGAPIASEYDMADVASQHTSTKVAELAQAQVNIILHAMKNLPNLQVVAYSTCSVFREENEDVVLQVLKRQTDFECVQAIADWPHRGLSEIAEFQDIAPLVCRATYEKDTTNGFFVCRFERIVDGDKKLTATTKDRKRSKESTAVGRDDEKSSSSKRSKTSVELSLSTGIDAKQVEERNVCKQFARYGKCKRGKKCRFSHVIPSVAKVKDDVDDLLADWC